MAGTMMGSRRYDTRPNHPHSGCEGVKLENNIKLGKYSYHTLTFKTLDT